MFQFSEGFSDPFIGRGPKVLDASRVVFGHGVLGAVEHDLTDREHHPVQAGGSKAREYASQGLVVDVAGGRQVGLDDESVESDGAMPTHDPAIVSGCCVCVQRR